MVAEDYCSSHLVKKYFRYWQDYVTEQQIMLWEEERQAEEHNEWYELSPRVVLIDYLKYSRVCDSSAFANL